MRSQKKFVSNPNGFYLVLLDPDGEVIELTVNFLFRFTNIEEF